MNNFLQDLNKVYSHGYMTDVLPKDMLTEVFKKYTFKTSSPDAIRWEDIETTYQDPVKVVKISSKSDKSGRYIVINGVFVNSYFNKDIGDKKVDYVTFIKSVDNRAEYLGNNYIIKLSKDYNLQYYTDLLREIKNSPWKDQSECKVTVKTLKI